MICAFDNFRDKKRRKKVCLSTLQTFGDLFLPFFYFSCVFPWFTSTQRLQTSNSCRIRRLSILSNENGSTITANDNLSIIFLFFLSVWSIGRNQFLLRIKIILKIHSLIPFKRIYCEKKIEFFVANGFCSIF